MQLILRGICLAALAVVVLHSPDAQGATQTLSVNILGSGTVSRNPSLSTYPNGSTVTLTATPAAGWMFSGWSNSISGALNPTNVLVDSDKVITATFSRVPDFPLAVNVSGSGSVSPSSGSFLSNTVVLLSATPANGWIFHRWMGDASGNANPLNVTMNSGKTIEAVFVQPPFISSQPSGGSADIGTTFSFSVNATGSAPLSYRWFFNDEILSSAGTPSLTLTNLEPGNGGAYQVVVSNPYGSATSSVAVLSVNCPGANVVSVSSDEALRAAIALGGTVRLCFSGTVTLTNTINIDKDVTLDAGGTSVVISGGSSIRLFNVSTGVVFQATNVAFVNGFYLQPTFAASGDGGAINNHGGTVRLVSCMLSNHFAIGGSGPNLGGVGRGGAIYNAGGTIEIYRTVLITNYAMGGSAGSGTGPAQGGAIYTRGGSVLIHQCDFVNNVAFSGLGDTSAMVEGGAIYLDESAMTVRDTRYSGNKATTIANSGTTGLPSPASVFGGALFARSGMVTLSRVQFWTNHASGAFSRNRSPSEAQGGAIWNGANLTIDTSTLAGCSATGGGGVTARSGRGGAIYNGGSLTLNATAIIHNQTVGGAGRNTGGFSGFPGADSFGGGIFNLGTLVATNCTLAGNSAQGGASGGSTTAGNAYGGGVFGGGGSITFMNVTIATNTANPGAMLFGSGGGFSLGANISSTNASFTLRNSLIADSGTNANVWGAVSDGGYNMCSDGSAQFSSGSSFNFTNPKLLPLANNGGPTPTMALASDSPALDFGTDVGAPPTDQRGSVRPFGAGVDIGAFESGPVPPPLVAFQNGSSITLSFDAEAGFTYDLWYSPNLRSWEITETIESTTSGIIFRTLPMTVEDAFYRLSIR